MTNHVARTFDTLLANSVRLIRKLKYNVLIIERLEKANMDNIRLVYVYTVLVAGTSCTRS